MNRLLTNELKNRAEKYPLYSQDGQNEDAKVISLLVLGNIKWYVLEADMNEEDTILFGITSGMGYRPEYGYISLDELAGLSVDLSKYGMNGTLYVEHVPLPEPIRLEAFRRTDNELDEFLSRMYDGDTDEQ